MGILCLLSLMTPDVIVLRGGSGTGKSSLLRSLRPGFPRGSAIDSDNIRDLLNLHDWMDPSPYRLCLSAVAAIARCHVAGGVEPVLIADTFAWPVLAGFLADLEGMRDVVVFSLYARPDTTVQRMTARDGDYLVGAALRNSLAQGAEQRITGPTMFAIDTDCLDEAEVLEVVMRSLSQGALAPSEGKADHTLRSIEIHVQG
jgi:hypothetical protein